MKAKFPDEKNRNAFAARLRKAATGEVFFSEENVSKYDRDVSNVCFSKCYACNKVAVWIYDRLVHPPAHDASPANGDMPIEVRADYDEAAQIVALSPRGAAALLRLSLQKLLTYLGQKGDNINDDIAALVKTGLDPRMQKSLDIVRVIGNNAVHPGQIDLRDDRKTADTLFTLINLIVDSLISQPKHIGAAYGALPEAARKAIEKRDEKP
jgi:hypothetical protein